ncbi:GHKL domain-containing protein, partial [[Clostridium] scindens]
KKDAKSHGLGIRNIREIIDRYNGTLDISYTEDTFTVTMLIRL